MLTAVRWALLSAICASTQAPASATKAHPSAPPASASGASGAACQRDQRYRGSAALWILCLRGPDGSAEILEIVLPIRVKRVAREKLAELAERRPVG